jgi:hypothetical protein
MEDTSYDEASRYLARRAGAPLLHWLLQLDGTHISFGSWLDSVLTIPGIKGRICDVVARMADLDKRGMPTACIVEFQSVPDPNMFGRLLLAGGLCWLTVKPVDLPGDRYELCAVVVNFTGQGDCARHMTLGTTEWKLTPRELNLEPFDAAAVLEEVATGKAPREVLAWISVMKNGGDPATMKRWLEIAGAETDLGRRGDYALVRLFAVLVGREEAWGKAVEALKMKEPQIVLDWKAEARSEGERTGLLRGKADALVRVLGRLGALPEDLVAGLRASKDSGQLDRWLDLALTARTIEDFRRDAGL